MELVFKWSENLCLTSTKQIKLNRIITQQKRIRLGIKQVPPESFFSL